MIVKVDISGLFMIKNKSNDYRILEYFRSCLFERIFFFQGLAFVEAFSTGR